VMLADDPQGRRAVVHANRPITLDKVLTLA
jgi:hypothetical protein